MGGRKKSRWRINRSKRSLQTGTKPSPAAVATARVLSEKYPRNYLFKLQMADALASQIVTLRKAKDATSTTGAAEQKELLGIFDSLTRDKTLERSTAELVQFRYREAQAALSQPQDKPGARPKKTDDRSP